MTPYDSAKVRAFLELALEAEGELFAGPDRTNERIFPCVRMFEQLTPWERVNALYEMRDRTVAAMNAKIRFMVEAARAADDNETQKGE